MDISKIIFGLHIAIFVVGILIPFVGSNQQLKSYSFIIPVLMFHWATNNDTCFLTELESRFAKVPKKRTFIGRIISPIYNLSDDQLGLFVKTLFFALWVFVQFKLDHIDLHL